MDKKQLEIKLDKFKNACVDAGCIDVENNGSLDLEESYPGMIPTSFIINLMVKKEWMTGKYHGSAIKELINLLYGNADKEALGNILTIRICDINKRDSLKVT